MIAKPTDLCLYRFDLTLCLEIKTKSNKQQRDKKCDKQSVDQISIGTSKSTILEARYFSSENSPVQLPKNKQYLQLI